MKKIIGCHICHKQKENVTKWNCSADACGRFFCDDCCNKNAWIKKPTAESLNRWLCPFCIRLCECYNCRTSRKYREEKSKTIRKTFERLLPLHNNIDIRNTLNGNINADVNKVHGLQQQQSINNSVNISSADINKTNITESESPTVQGSPITENQISEQEKTDIIATDDNVKGNTDTINSIGICNVNTDKVGISKGNTVVEDNTLIQKRRIPVNKVSMKKSTEFEKKGIHLYENYRHRLSRMSGSQFKFSNGNNGIAVNIPIKENGAITVFEITDISKNSLGILISFAEGTFGDDANKLRAICNEADDLKFNNKGKVNVNSGNLLITDPSYVLPDEPIEERKLASTEKFSFVKQVLGEEKTIVGQQLTKWIKEFDNAYEKVDFSQHNDHELFVILLHMIRGERLFQAFEQTLRERAQTFTESQCKFNAIADLFTFLREKRQNGTDIDQHQILVSQ